MASPSTNDNTTDSQAKSLQWLNYANVAAYIVNTVVTYGVGVYGKFPTNAELSAKYQTLVTPAGFAFAIWGIIFTAELIWCILQLLPKYRSQKLVTDVVGWNYVYVCLAQFTWTLCFSTERIALSLVAMVSILIPLLIIITNSLPVPNESVASYWLLKFPFEIHCGWILAATLVNTNVLLVAWHVDTAGLVGSAWLSLGSVAIVASYYTYKQVWTIPAVLAWASNGIRSELSNPKESIVNAFSPENVAAVKTSSGILAIGILIGMIIRFIIHRFFADGNTATSRESADTPSSSTPLIGDEN